MYDEFIVQAILAGILIQYESDHPNEDAARMAAADVLMDPTFAGMSVRLITRDGEVVWDSSKEST